MNISPINMISKSISGTATSSITTGILSNGTEEAAKYKKINESLKLESGPATSSRTSSSIL